MPHIFRFHAGRNNNIYDWKASDKIMPADVRDVMDKTNVITSAAGTSIPTPIARMYLFKTAFEIIAAQVRDNNVDSNGIYAGLVSETLDLLELLYKCGSDESKFRFKRWVFDCSQQDDDLTLSFFGNESGHKLLAESFKQAAGQAPFNNKIEITLIYYKEGNKEILAGGTSPFTFVFTSPNFIRKLKTRDFKTIAGLVSDDILFDSDYKQLHERDESFIKYIESLVSNQTISESFKGVAEYVVNTKNLYFKKFNGIISTLVDIQIEDITLNSAKINLKQLKEEDYKLQIESNSDFVMDLPEGTNYNQSHKPLFLLDRMDMDGQYTSSTNKWSSQTKISSNQYPEIGFNQILARELPGTGGFKYPFLTNFDFFEINLIKLPGYVLNKEKFITITDSQDFIIPLKPIFFNFFPIKDIRNYLKVSIREDQFTFELRIPITGPTKNSRPVICQKTYTINDFINYEGIIAISPLTHTKQEDIKYINKYTVASYERTNEVNKVDSIYFFEKSGIHHITAPYISRTDDELRKTKSGYYLVNQSFDIVQINFNKNGVRMGGIILPKFVEVENGTEEYIYSIDFGTSNTHVEYGRVVNEKVISTNPFTISEKEMQIAFLHEPKEVIIDDGTIRYNDYIKPLDSIYKLTGVKVLFRREFMPFEIGNHKSANVKFPFRTATCESKGFVVNAINNRLFADANIGFFMEEDQASTQDKPRYITDLKWNLEKSSADKLHSTRIALFFRELLLMIRTSALLNKNETADLSKLKFVMSFPNSMGPTLKNELKKLFIQQQKEIIGSNSQELIEVSESIAPYYQMRTQNYRIQNDSFCNIDIGGGTTDVVLIDKSKDNPNVLETYCSSFKFAGRQLWSSGHNEYDINNNGFLSYYKELIKNSNPDVYSELEQLLNSNSLRTEDVVSTLFSKEEYKFGDVFAVKREFRVVLVIHYAAILYYISRVAQFNNIALPRTISFSGKGSEYLNLIFPNRADLKNLTQKLLSIFSGTAVRPDFMIEMSNEPKVITAKGAVYCGNEKITIKDDVWDNEKTSDSNEKTLDIINYSYKGFNKAEFEHSNLTYGSLLNDPAYYESIMSTLSNFFNLLFDDPSLCKALNAKLEISDFAKYKAFFINGDTEQLGQHGELRDSFFSVLNKMNNTESVNDSPFFFGLNYSLIELSKEISKEVDVA